MTSEEYIKLGRNTAIFSFLGGTLLFLVHFFTSDYRLIFVGLAYIVIVGIYNLGLLVLINIKANKDALKRKKLLSIGGLMLLNIPIALFYIWAAVVLLNTMRITFTNSTQALISDINIEGCETKYIDSLEPNESKTIWVGIKGDCFIQMNYLLEGERIIETVASYVTGTMGQKMRFRIGAGDALQF